MLPLTVAVLSNSSKFAVQLVAILKSAQHNQKLHIGHIGGPSIGYPAEISPMKIQP